MLWTSCDIVSSPPSTLSFCVVLRHVGMRTEILIRALPISSCISSTWGQTRQQWECHYLSRVCNTFSSLTGAHDYRILSVALTRNSRCLVRAYSFNKSITHVLMTSDLENQIHDYSSYFLQSDIMKTRDSIDDRYFLILTSISLKFCWRENIYFG